MEYLVKDPEGNQYGPAKQENIIEWAKDGRILPETLIRNRLFASWRSAEEYDFLRPYLFVEDPKKSITTILYSKKKYDSNTSIIATIFRYTSASLARRALACFIDLIIIFIAWFIPFSLLVVNLPKETVVSPFFISMSALAFTSLFLFYNTLLLGLRAQTFGMCFWGIMIVNARDGAPVLTYRAFLFTLLTVMLSIIDIYVIYISPSRRSLHERITRTRVILVRRKMIP